MSNETATQAIQKTQKVLGKYIKKPPLTEKLLKKPPFRFLHDIVTNVIRETGFLKGLYSERELVSENVKEKDDKVAFLNKLIDAIKAITGEQLGVRATKVIAGLESTETNLLLQSIGTALNKKLDSSQYVAQLKSDKKSKNQTNAQLSEKKVKHEKSKDKVEKQDEKKKAPTIQKAGKITDRSKGIKGSSSRGSVESSRNVDVKAKAKTKKAKEKSITPRDSETDKGVKEGVKEKNDDIPDLAGDKNQEIDVEINNLQKEKLVGELDQGPLNNEVNKITTQETSENYASNEQSNKAQIDDDLPLARLNSLQPKRKDDEETVESATAKEIKTERVKSARPKTGNLKRNQEDTPQSVSLQPVEAQNNDKQIYVRPRSSLRPPSVRPSSARPGAPRLRSDTSLPEGEVVPLGKVNVIVENYNNKDLDEEETVTIQTAPEPDYQTPILQLPTDKGHLVEQILEQIQQSDMEHTKPTVNIEWEQDGFRNRNAANKEIEQLKTAIQTLTRTANPLGKLVNYLHEDIEAMHSELDMWVNSARQIMADVANQKRISDESNKPLQVQLEEIEENIIKHQQQIVSVHGNILRNEQRIRDLLVK